MEIGILPQFFFPEMTWNDDGSSESVPEMVTSYIKKEEDKWTQHFNNIFFHKSKDC